MTGLSALIKRNTKLFFKDKAMFFTSLITPIILLVLYVTFLADVYRDSFASAIPESLGISDSLIDGTVGAQLLSSLLAVCCVTVAFCSNMLTVQDKVNGTRADIDITPVRQSVVAVGYYISNVISTLTVCYTAMLISFVYLGAVGWYLSASDVAFLVLDVFLVVLFGSALSSAVGYFLTSQGQISAVGTVVSAGYGFICGAYMPISQFGEGLQRVISFLPGTYGTSLLRNHAMRGALAEMENAGIPAEVISAVRDSIDCNVYFFGHSVEVPVMYAILIAAILLITGIYVLLNFSKFKKVSARSVRRSRKV